MYEYSRTVHYYETDKMGVVHHSNYIRWLEEARDAFFNDADLPYVVTESLGIMSPITELSVKYKYPARYGDTFTVKLEMTKYSGVRFAVSYTVVNQDGAVLIEAESSHAFIDKDHGPVPLSRRVPEKHELMKKLMSGTVPKKRKDYHNER